AVEQVLKEIGATQPLIAVYNKVDLVDHLLEVREPDQAVSAKTGYNLERLTKAVYEFFAREYTIREYFFPFNQLGKASILREQAAVLGEQFTAEGLVIKAEVDARLEMLLKPFQK
ncbi:MAG TPA: hypothetical protein PLM25_06475, partial [Limnochordia bacterium]|nr:hypothetical protein [Limnochordia bacterium]